MIRLFFQEDSGSDWPEAKDLAGHWGDQEFVDFWNGDVLPSVQFKDLLWFDPKTGLREKYLQKNYKWIAVNHNLA